jgi:two-component system OmpR family sensor kinase
MSGREEGGIEESALLAAALEDPHALVWLLDHDGSLRHAGEDAMALIGDGEEAVVGEPFPATPWWGDAAVDEHVRRATAGEFVRFRASVDGTSLDVALRPIADEGEIESVLAVGRESPTAVDRHVKLAALHDAATRLESVDDEDAVHELTVQTATNVLSFDHCFVGVFEGESVVPRAWSASLSEADAAAMDLGGWLAGRILSEGHPVVVDDASTVPDDAVPDETHTAWLGVPIDETTVLVAADSEAGAFDQPDRELADVLAAHAGAALRRVRHQRRLRRQNERLEEFASVVAHDLRNPLGAMRANLQVAREIDGEEVLDAIERSLDRMDQLLENLLALASVGEEATEPEQVLLSAVAEEAWETAAPTEATLEVSDDLRFDADPSRLQQLLENLFDNAVEHGGQSVHVGVGAVDSHGFYVADDGPGVPPDEREDVFEHGFTTSDDGTGFGLSIVRRIAETHGWQATVTESDDGGARFEFTGVEAAERPGD